MDYTPFMVRIALAIGCLLGVTAPAGAVTYALEDVAYNQAALNWNVLAAPAISLTISQSAVDRGSFIFHASTGPLSTSGDVADLIAFRIGSTTLGPTGYGVLYSHLNIALSFAADGTVNSGTIDWLSPSNEFELSGTAESFGGTFSLSDSSSCGYNSNPIYDCRLSGIFVDPPDPAPISEPNAAALLALPLLWFGLDRLRRR
jgi:hypothetical protein